jgi:hypothetical protein
MSRENLLGRLRSAGYARPAGEVKTGSAGEQPDQGIAGRNSSAGDEKERAPLGAFFDLGPGPTGGRRSGPEVKVLVLIPIGPNRFRHALKSAYRAPGMLWKAAGIEWRGRDRRKCSRASKSPGLRAGCAEHFPV